MIKKYINKVFVIEDDEIFGRVIQRTLEQEDNLDVTVFKNGKDFFDNLHQCPDIVTIDYNLPDMSGLEILVKIKEFNKDIITLLLSGQEDVQIVVNAYNSGATRYIVKNDRAMVELVNAVKIQSSNVSLRKEVNELRSQIIDRSKYYQLLGESSCILKVLRLIQKVENNDILVMITGESGTGKELVARALHYNSGRKRNSFVPVNVGAIPEDLVESELFGHEKGAFTGANERRIGKFEEAHGGTIFLDEIGEMDMLMQTKLLRVLQEKKICRLGTNKEIKLDVRIVAATNKNLAQLVKEGKFREDLYYRLQGFLIHLPALRERDNDVLLLAKYFLDEFCRESRMPAKSFSKSAMEDILNHSWPGNIRELKSLVERSALISDTDKVEQEDLVFSQLVYS
jgi:two-component system response regulator AtoC